MSNELTSARLTIVVTGSCSRFRTLTIPMDGVQSNQLHPRFVRQLNPKDMLQEIPLLKSNLWAITISNKKTVRISNKTSKRKRSLRQTDTYQTRALYPKFCPLACTPNRQGDTSNRPLEGRSTDSSSFYLNQGSHTLTRVTVSLVGNYTCP